MAHRTRYPGTILVLTTTLITFILWLYSHPTISEMTTQPLRYLTQLIGNLTVVYMSISLVLSMRMHIIDKIFHGLDKSYKFHALIGSIAFLLMIAHPLILVINALPNIDRASYYLIPRDRLAANIGLSAVYLAIFAFTFMTFLKLPYNHWLNTHRILAVSFLLGSIHGYLAPSNLFRDLPLAVWIGLWTLLGLSAAVYSVILYRKFGVRYPYTISQIDHLGDVVQITLTPNKHQMPFCPGQFIYVRFHNPHISGELHPFSPSSAEQESTLRISVKILGDFTKKMATELQVGEQAEIYGPFGAFYEEYTQGTSDLIWIGGGIGVTPFMSMLHAESLKASNKKLLFYYSVNKPQEAVFDPELSELQKLAPAVTYIKWIADEQGFLTMEKIMEKAKEIGLTEPKILLCGPQPMMDALTSQAAKMQIAKDRIIFEQFTFLP